MKRSFWIGMGIHLAIALGMLLAGIILAVKGAVYGPFVCLGALIYIGVGVYMFGFACHFADKDKK